ncbi:MAG: ABC transporter substrate-binding protein [Candidatus Aminicenantes bacterium]|nr:MAG: ABC transporter substrate-binding protein [Candidatus Aminicenantes bacterium]
MEKLKYFSIFILCFCLLWVTLAQVMIMRPLEVVRRSNRNVREILKGHKIVDEQTEARLLQIIDRVTDFETISQRVIQRFCEKLTKQQCETFDRVFQRLLRVSSLKKMGRYRANRFDYLSEEMTGKTAVVKTIAYYKEEKAQLDYHLEFKNDKWMIVNYVVDDIDTVRNYKKQFMRLFAKNTFNQVMERLRKKIADYEKENRAQ